MRARELFAIAAGCGPFVAVPISASATSAHVAATIAVPSTLAGRESAGRSRGARRVRRCRFGRGGVLAGVEPSGSQLVCGCVEEVSGAETAVTGSGAQLTGVGVLAPGSVWSAWRSVVNSIGSHGVADRGGAAATGSTDVGTSGCGPTGIGSDSTGRGSTAGSGARYCLTTGRRCLASNSDRSCPASDDASENARSRICSPYTRLRGT